MSFYQGRESLPRRFRLVLSSVLQAAGLPFSDVLAEQDIEDAFDDADAWFAQEEDDMYLSILRTGLCRELVIA